jgi:hypothetical protein
MAETYTSLEDPRDWRGVPITIGALVIYGAPVGRSIAMVEATVESFTKTGRVNVRPVRRAYGGHFWRDSRDTVHVGQDRLTVVGELPTPLMPTEEEKRAAHEAEQAERKRVEATHLMTVNNVNDQRVWQQQCERCGLPFRERFTKECAS